MSNDEAKTNTADGQSALKAIVMRCRTLEVDHEPEGWPAIKMKDVSALCDEVEKLYEDIDRWYYELSGVMLDIRAIGLDDTNKETISRLRREMGRRT